TDRVNHIILTNRSRTRNNSLRTLEEQRSTASGKGISSLDAGNDSINTVLIYLIRCPKTNTNQVISLYWEHGIFDCLSRNYETLSKFLRNNVNIRVRCDIK